MAVQDYLAMVSVLKIVHVFVNERKHLLTPVDYRLPKHIYSGLATGGLILSALAHDFCLTRDRYFHI